MAKTALTRMNAAPLARLEDVVGEVRLRAPGQEIVDPQLVAAAARAWSPNTVRAFLSDIRLWDAWCRQSRVGAGEVTYQTVAGYIRALSGQDHATEAGRATPQRAAATIARYLVNIGWAYRMAGAKIQPPRRSCGSSSRRRARRWAPSSARRWGSATKVMSAISMRWRAAFPSQSCSRRRGAISWDYAIARCS